MIVMKNLGYVFRRLFDMDYGAMLKKINMLHKKTGRSRLWILRDMQRCAVNYGAGYMDYDLYEMYNLTAEQRDTYLTRGRMNELVRKYNDQTKIHVFDSKAEFNVRFEAYLNRDWVDVTEENRESVAFHEKFSYEKRAFFPNCGVKFGRWLGIFWMEKRLKIVEIPTNPPVSWLSIGQNSENSDDILDTLSLS